MVELEKRGKPTVALTASGFVHDSRRSARSFGMAALPIAVVPSPFTNQPPEHIHAMVDAALDQVVAGLTGPLGEPAPASGEIIILPDETLAFEGEDLLEAAAAMDRQFLGYGWSDGFPLVPPTRRAVEAMLRGTVRRPDEVICVLEPGFGYATVEKLAVNAVMAGCRPEHLPVLIAATQCLAEPKMYLRNKAMSTGPHAPLILANGPITQQLGLNSKTCALGPGSPSYANTVIGRALRLIMMNVGHTYPGVSDMDTVGSPLKYSLCVAENEEANPWVPYHMEQGFQKDDSTVTVMFVYGICELHDFESRTPERLGDVFCTAATNVAQVGTGLWLIGRRGDPRYKTEEKEHNLLLLCPEHAQLMARAGWDKAVLRKYLYDHARLPFKTLMLNKGPKALQAAHPELQWLWDYPDTPLPIVETPECFDIAVVGGSAGRGAYLYGAGEPVTKLVGR
ncbi:MAG: hypothetical protein HY683_04385 [Chloroflexi bacterium]|nr:hypothetical protein [Chloroflexota bacterium]